MMRPPEPDPPKNVKTTVKIKEETNNNVLLEGAELESVEDYIEKVIHIRTKKVGYLIGTAGRTIRGFENNSGAKIDIMSPNSTDQETPVLLSGTAESVRNVLRMIMDLYHMNNFSSQLWQHLRNNEHKDNKDNDLDENGKEKIYAHEQVMVPKDFLLKFPKLVSTLESENGVRMDIGRELEEYPGQIPLGVIGTAVQNVKTIDMINDSLEKFRIQQSEIDEIKAGMENWSKLQNSIGSAYKRRRISSDSDLRHYHGHGEPRLDPFSTRSPNTNCCFSNPTLLIEKK